MSDLDQLWQTVITRVQAVPAVSSVKPSGARATIAAALTSDALAERSPGSPVLVLAEDGVTEIEVNIAVLADVSAAATGLAVANTIVDVLRDQRIDEQQVTVRVLSVGH